MNRFLARAGRLALAALLALGASAPLVARADAPSTFWFAGTSLVFDRVQTRGGALAVPIGDPGLVRFLGKLSATLSYARGQSYVTITTADRRTVSFTLGTPAVRVDDVAQAAAFGPYVDRGQTYLPFIDLARALGVVPVSDGGTIVLQPQIVGIDVRTDKGVTYVAVRGASTLRFRRVDERPGRLVVAFVGTAATVDRSQSPQSASLSTIAQTASGTARNPTTTLDFESPSGAAAQLVPSDDPNVVSFAFGAPGVAMTGVPVPAAAHQSLAPAPPNVAAPAVAANANPVASQAPAPVLAAPGPVALATPTADTLPTATITALTTDATDSGFDVHVAISGPVTYEWHRLSDNRWYVDFKPATLAIAPQDGDVDADAVTSLRLKPFVGPNDKLATVRLGLSLPSPRRVSVAPSPGGLTVSVGNDDDPSPILASAGELVDGKLVAIVPLPAPPQAPPLEDTAWKFGAPVDGSRLIVIDPGHGGSDPGSVHNGLTESALTLDLSRRLRAALIARGWVVRMTRDTDVDVYGPNASARDELQARDDVANRLHARIFVSVHVNASESSTVNGTTTYFYKPDSYGLARDIHDHLATALPTADDGVLKDNFWVIHHAAMPAVLIETAFDSNPGDAALLRSDSFKDKVAAAIADGIGQYAQPAGAPPRTDDGN